MFYLNGWKHSASRFSVHTTFRTKACSLKSLYLKLWIHPYGLSHWTESPFIICIMCIAVGFRNSWIWKLNHDTGQIHGKINHYDKVLRKFIDFYFLFFVIKTKMSENQFNVYWISLIIISQKSIYNVPSFKSLIWVSSFKIEIYFYVFFFYIKTGNSKKLLLDFKTFIYN